MSEAKFKVGDRVRLANSPNHEGVVVDAFVSQINGWRYEFTTNQRITFFAQEDELELASEEKEYSMTIQIDIASNVVIASMFETEGDTMRPLAKGHGHMIHGGELGIAQAASYACKKLYENLGGTINKGGSWR